MDHGSGCPLCYANCKGRSNYPGHRGFRRPPSPFQEPLRMFIKRASGAGQGGAEGGVAEDAHAAAIYPALVEHLTILSWDDGKRRKPSSLLLFTEDGLWKLCLTDKDAGRVAFVAGATIQEVAGRLERMLQEDSLEWRKQKPFPGRR